jgi:purine-binding chemotaxis protein CheW
MSQNADTFILFKVSGTTYAASSAHVRQIEMIDHITPLPNSAEYVEGVVFTRGEVIPAVNLRLRFGFPREAHSVRSRLIVISHSGRQVGLIVDSAREFMAISPDTIQPPPDSVAGLSGRYLKGIVTIEDRIILVLDLEEVVNFAPDGGAPAAVQPESRRNM